MRRNKGEDSGSGGLIVGIIILFLFACGPIDSAIYKYHKMEELRGYQKVCIELHGKDLNKIKSCVDDYTGLFDDQDD